MTQVVEYFEIIIPRCANTYGVPPCTASLVSSPVTGTAKCFNCLATCQDIPNFVDTTATLRFAVPTEFLPDDIDIVGPWVKNIDFTPATISLAENIGTRAVLKVTLEDHPHSDAGEGLDQYQSERGYDPYERGSFWPRFRARYPSPNGFECAWYIGEVGQALEDMEKRTFWIDSFNGPTASGEFSFTAKDALKFLDANTAQIPALSDGSLIADIDAVTTTITLTPTGAGADYPSDGYVNIGGNEIAVFSKGVDSYTSLLLHGDGTDASTTFTDSSSFANVPTQIGGNVQIDTAQSKFGGSSIAFDGTGDFFRYNTDTEFLFGTGDFTIDGWIRRNATGAAHVIFDCRPSLTAGIYVTVLADSNNALALFVNGANRSAGGSVTANVWHHFAIVRKSAVSRAYLNGVQVGSDYADTNNYLLGTGRPVIGIAGDLSSASFNGWIDDLRVSKGIARWWGTSFTVPTAPSGGADDLTIYPRGALNTTASTHSAGDRVQLVKRYASQAASDIIADAIENYSDLDPNYIDLPAWQLEDSTYLGTLFTFTISEPIGVGLFVSRVLEQAGAMLWDDALEKQLRFKAITAVTTSADVIDESLVVNKTFEPTDQPDQRFSRSQVYYGIFDPTKKRDELANYRQSSKRPDEDVALENEAIYGPQSIKTILADGIAIGGTSVADRVGNLLIGRKQRPPRRFRWQMLRGSADMPSLGGGYFLEWRSLQDASGEREQVPVQVLSEKPSATLIHYVAEEMRFTDLDAGSNLDRVFLLNFNTMNVNLRDLHDLTYASDFAGVTVTFIITATIGSTSTSVPAVDVGDWPVGFVPTVQLRGRIQGHGGNGAAPTANGNVGGVALYTRHDIDLELDVGDAEIWGGGGGGGGGSGGFVPGAGGGGAGTNPGLGGVGAAGNGGDGTSEVGGASGPTDSSPGGAGGGPGLAGANAPVLGGTGGAAGAAIDGLSYVTKTGTGDIRGGQIN